MNQLIYVIDDSRPVLMSMSSTLELTGYQVQTATSPTVAIDELRSKRVDLIITDINMPEMDGLELIRTIRSAGANQFTPILTLTTKAQERKRQAAKEAGANGWLIKPIFAPNLDKVLKQLLSREG
ncbi:MAG: response regulator [Oceanobacter sp.]